MKAPLFPARRPLLPAILGALALASDACSPTEPESPPPFLLEQVTPRDEKREGVLLNEPLSFHFNAGVDPLSITSESLMVRRLPRGEEPGAASPVTAAGTFQVVRRQVTFLPKLARQRNLQDGGFLPGETYEVWLRGFPVPDGIRSVDGRLLDHSYSLRLTTAERKEGEGQLFYDPSTGTGRESPQLRADRPRPGESPRESRGEVLVIPPEGPIYITYPEPIDPTTLVDDEFELHRADSARRIGLNTSLDENSRELGAVIELTPPGPLDEGDYSLHFAKDECSLRDLGNGVVLRRPLPGDEPRLIVSDTGGTIVESFLDPSQASWLTAPGVDGTAFWGGDGVVTIRYPRAAGNGSAGPKALTGPYGAEDLQATRLTVPRDATAELLSAPGPVTLRAQGLLSVSGTLSRHCGDAAPLEPPTGELLSGWLERVRASEQTVTVLVAGGDLVIDGHVDVDGPLVLVAGGRIRIPGEVEAQEDQLWRVGDGGGSSLGLHLRDADLVIDPPPEERNPLVEELTFCVLSTPIPHENTVPHHWVRAEVEQRPPAGTAGANRAEVFFTGEKSRGGETLEEWELVSDPAELAGPGPLRLVLLLHVGPPDLSAGGSRSSLRWDPPLIDEVRLYWLPQDPSAR